MQEPLTHVVAQRGGFVTLNECAVSKQTLSLHMKHGGHIKLNAEVKKVALTAQEGGFFNQDFEGRLTADEVNLNCGFGCVIHLGQAKKVSGTMLMGGQLYAKWGSNLKGLHKTVGASVHVE